jgi:hypothetical protein
MGIRPQKLGMCENHLHICSIKKPNEFYQQSILLALFLKTIKMKTNTFIIGGLLAFSLNLSAQNYASKSMTSHAFTLTELGESRTVFEALNDLGEDFYVALPPKKESGCCCAKNIFGDKKASKFLDDFYRERRLFLSQLTQKESNKTVALRF